MNGNLMVLWVGMVVPATILVSSLSFALRTVLPRLAMLVKVVILVGWIVGGVVLPAAYRDTTPPTWYVNWDPPSGVTGIGMLSYPEFSGRQFLRYLAAMNGLPSSRSTSRLRHSAAGQLRAPRRKPCSAMRGLTRRCSILAAGCR